LLRQAAAAEAGLSALRLQHLPNGVNEDEATAADCDRLQLALLDEFVELRATDTSEMTALID